MNDFYDSSKKDIQLSTHEIMNGLTNFALAEIDYETDKLYMISDKLLESDINKKIFKFKNNIIFEDIVSKIISKM